MMDANSRPTIIVSGFLGLFDGGGVTWDYLQYPLGLHELGYDVYYLEDTGLWPVYNRSESSGSCKTNVRRVRETFRAFGLDERWIYVDAITGKTFGMADSELAALLTRADLLINVSCSLVMRDSYQNIPIRILIDSDPMFTQVQYQDRISFTEGESSMRALVQAHTHCFTFGENIGKSDCLVPTCKINWRPTRQPVCLSHWTGSASHASSNNSYTTVMNWSVTAPMDYGGDSWGQKDVEFMHLFALPKFVPALSLSVAIGNIVEKNFPKQAAEEMGWVVLDASEVAGDWRNYRKFIQQSRGEFSVAKETYVKARTGWFSCRSACYLAAGRPVVAQDTGWSSYIATGEGLFAFDSPEDACEALLEVDSDHSFHSQKAREVALNYFDSRKVLTELLESAGCC